MTFTILVGMAVITPLILIVRSVWGNALHSTNRLRSIAIVLSGAILGLCVGSWVGCGLEFQVGEAFRPLGASLPLVIFHLKSGNCVDCVSPFPAFNGVVKTCIVFLSVMVPFDMINTHRGQA